MQSTNSNKKVRQILITDLQLHFAPKRDSDLRTVIKKTLAKPDNIQRGYWNIQKFANPSDKYGTATFSIPFENLPEKTLTEIQRAEDDGCEVEFVLPPGGANVYFGKDSVEFLKSKNGQRILRKMGK
jgi:hypothetical protein